MDTDSLSGAWDAGETERFLESSTVPLRVACRTPDDEPWLLSLWYLYRDGALWCATGADADVVRYLRHDDGVAFEASTNHPPYRGSGVTEPPRSIPTRRSSCSGSSSSGISAGRTRRSPGGCSRPIARRSVSGSTRRGSTRGTSPTAWPTLTRCPIDRRYSIGYGPDVLAFFRLNALDTLESGFLRSSNRRETSLSLPRSLLVGR